MKRKLTFLGAILLAAFIFTCEGNTYRTHALDEEDQAWIDEAGEALQKIVEEREIMALVYLCDELPIRSEADNSSAIAGTAASGQMVEILDVTVDEDYQVWEKVSAEISGKTYVGYIPRDHLACSDERFLEWEELYGMNPGAEMMLAEENATGVYADIEEFPESYRPALQALKQQHPNWTFVRQNTGLDFQTAVNNELQGGKSLVYKSYGDYCKEGQHSPNWYFASEDVLKLYMDPRNALQENAIFQFEQLTYNESYHTEEAVKNFLEGTFMNSSQNAPGTDMKFYHIFWTIGAEENRQVSPFHLAARVLQEQGQGTSPLISGIYPGYEGYYNYFNVGASGSTNEQVIINGLNYAKNNNWKGAYYSILGGAEVISANYIRKGQDTLYLQKFNVSPTASNPIYTHQYMQNISAPTTEALSIKNCMRVPEHWRIPLYSRSRSTKICRQAPARCRLRLPTWYCRCRRDMMLPRSMWTVSPILRRCGITAASLPFRTEMHRQQWSIVIMPTVRLSACMSGPWNTVTMPMWRRNSRS